MQALKQSEWLMSSAVSRLVLAIVSVETDETLERWQFDIKTDEESLSARGGAAPPSGAPSKSGKTKEKTEKEVQGEIREIMKQITSSITFLPILEEPCEPAHSLICRQWLILAGTFTLLAYTNDSTEVAIPATWGDADPHLIDRGKVEQVRLRSFNTNHHALEVSRSGHECSQLTTKAMVAYRVGE